MRTLRTAPTALGLALLVSSCNTSQSPPPLTSPSPTVREFSVSGQVTEDRGGPLAGVHVEARLADSPGTRAGATDSDDAGMFRLDGLTQRVNLIVSKTGYQQTGAGTFDADRVVNLTMVRRLEVIAGKSLTGVIGGDSLLNGEDDTGAGCDANNLACLGVDLSVPGPGTVTVRLTWPSPGSQLGLFVSTGFFAGVGKHGASPLEVSVDARFATSVIVSYDSVNGRRPTAADVQPFELTTTFNPR